MNELSPEAGKCLGGASPSVSSGKRRGGCGAGMKMTMKRMSGSRHVLLASLPRPRDGLRPVFRALSLFLVLLALLGAAPALAEKKGKGEPKLPVPPPQPVAQELTVRRGEPLEIRLTIHGRKYENLKYLIRTGPDRGKLTEPKVVTQEASVVIYTPPANLAVKRDHFTYAVQNIDGVSAAVDVNITIADDAAQLMVPDVIDFAPLLTGGAAFKEMELTNIGGSIAAGEVQVAAPWRIEGPTEYRLPAGGKQKFLVFFEPKAAGVFRGEIRYTSQIDRVTTLRGTGEAAIGVAPAQLILPVESGSTARAGRLELTNNTPGEQALKFTGSARLHLPAPLTLAAGEKQTVTVSSDESEPGPLDETLTIEGTGLQVAVPVRAKAVGPVLKIARDLVPFPTVKLGQAASADLAVGNLGGAEGSWKAGVELPFQAQPATFRLAPGERKEVRISINAQEVGTYRGWIRFEGEQQTKEARLEADVVEVASTAPAAPRSTQPAAAATPNPAVTRLAKETDERISSLLYLRDNVKVRNVVSDGATIDWPTALTVAHTCRVELRNTRLDDQGHLRVDWLKPPISQVKVMGDRFFAELRGLRPGTLNTVRIVPVAEGGEAGDPIFMTQFLTLPPKAAALQITGFRVTIFLLVAFAAAAYAWQRVKAQRGE